MSRFVKPRLLRGFKDILPDKMNARNRLIDIIREVYESFGFMPLETPALEHEDVLLGKYGEESTKQIFRFTNPEDEPVAMRFDLTVSLARVFAQYQDIPTPLRRYEVGRVWRADKPDPGRYREFLQFDLDIVGSSSMAADAEMIAGFCAVADKLGLKHYRVRFSDRKILNALLAYSGIPAAMSHDVFRVLDKLDKHGMEAVRLELGPGRTDASGDRIPGLGLKDSQISRMEGFLSIEAGDRRRVLKELSKLFEKTPEAEEGLSELNQIVDILDLLEIDDDKAALDVSVARGLDYYTGPVYEAILLDAPRYGSVFGGGRYDGLVARFSKRQVPATGGSIGVDRLLDALIELGVFKPKPSTADVIVTTMDRSLMPEYHKMASELRRAGLNVDLYLGNQKSLGKQLQYADRLAIPVAVIAGSDEVGRGEVSVKNLVEGIRASARIDDREEWTRARFGQKTVSRQKLVETVREALQAVSGRD